MTDIIDILSSAPPRDSRKRCYYAEWLAEQTPEFQTAISKAMAPGSKWKSTDIYKLVHEQKGYERQYNSLRLHRAGDCSCGK